MTETPSAALHGSVLSALGTAIVSGTHAPGDVLTLDGVCVRYQVSRSVAREAIRVCDGGAQFWGAVFDPASNTFSELQFNGGFGGP